MICWLASYPRSGNSLFRMSLNRFCGIRTASVFEESKPGGIPPTPVDPRPLSVLRELSATVPVKTHRLADADEPTSAIYIVRDGRDSVVSYAHFLGRRESDFDGDRLNEMMARVVEGERGFGSWSSHVRTWTSRQAPTYLVRFEDLLADPARVVRKAAGELGLPVAPLRGVPVPLAIEEVRAKSPTLVRRGIVGSWRSEMPPDLERRFWELHGEQMLEIGYER